MAVSPPVNQGTKRGLKLTSCLDTGDHTLYRYPVDRQNAVEKSDGIAEGFASVLPTESAKRGVTFKSVSE
ncbi:hypothetical protein GP163_004495 [Salmonella enterica]|nr:hypothetical protein [Salmonella enterica]